MSRGIGRFCDARPLSQRGVRRRLVNKPLETRRGSRRPVEARCVIHAPVARNILITLNAREKTDGEDLQ